MTTASRPGGPAVPWLILATLAVLAVLVAGCGGTPQPARVDEAFLRAPVPAELQVGQRLYDAYCATCHGQRGIGTEQGPPFVHRVYDPNRHADLAFLNAATRGVRAHHWRFGNMPPVEGVAVEQVTEIVRYVRWLQRQARIE